jgi:DNA topoisomerase VI subunit B
MGRIFDRTFKSNMSASEKQKKVLKSQPGKQRSISVSEFFLKNRHLLGFDNPRRALLTAVKEGVDNSLDACDEAGILPVISVDIDQIAKKRFKITVIDNGPGLNRRDIPKIFARLLYGSKFHRLRMSRGQQGIGISAAGMYGQLTTGTATVIYSKLRNSSDAHYVEVQMNTRNNKPTILKDQTVQWKPNFYITQSDNQNIAQNEFQSGTAVTIEMEAVYVCGKLSVDEYLKQCAIVNPHMQLHYRIRLLNNKSGALQKDKSNNPYGWTVFKSSTTISPKQPKEIMPHPHGVELGMLMQMMKETKARSIKSALITDFSRVSPRVAKDICFKADIQETASPRKIAQKDIESLYNAIQETKLMRPPTDCLSPIGEKQIISGLEKEVEGDFYTAVTRSPRVYRGNPFQIEVGIACSDNMKQDNSTSNQQQFARIMRFANKVPLLYMTGACAITKAVTNVSWKNYGLQQSKGSLPAGPVVIVVHIASVWVPFTSESKEAIAHYPEIIKEITFALQECGRRLGIYLNKKRRKAEQLRKHRYIELYLPHLAHGLQEILDLSDNQQDSVVGKLEHMLEKTHLQI